MEGERKGGHKAAEICGKWETKEMELCSRLQSLTPLNVQETLDLLPTSRLDCQLDVLKLNETVPHIFYFLV